MVNHTTKSHSPKSMQQINQSFGKIIHSTKVTIIGILLSAGTTILSISLFLKIAGTRTSTFATMASVCSCTLVSPAGITLSSFSLSKIIEFHKQ